MSTASRLSVLAFAAGVLASPAAHGHAHAHRHLHSGSAAPYPYKGMNSTSIYATTGTGAAPTAYGSETTLTSTITGKTTMYTTIFETISLSAAPSGASVGAAGYSSGSGECGADVTVTSTEQVTVTVTAGDVSSSSVVSAVSASSSASAPAYSAPAYSAPSSSSSEVAPVSTSSSSTSAPAYSAPAYTPSSVSSSSSEAAPVTTSSSVAAVSSAPAYTPSTESSSSSSVAAVIPSSYSVADKGSGSTPTSSAAASYTSAVSTGGKRGLAFNDTTADLISCFSGSTEVSWAYNWVSSAGASLGNFNYIPTLHSSDPVFTAVWEAEALAAIASGSTTLFSFNEPDISSQANMDVATAVSYWKQYMEPLAGKAKLCAPSVSNSGSPDQGLDYLQQFLDACTDCTIDCLSIHWYGTEASNLQNQTDAAVSMANGKPVWVSEFAITGLDDAGVETFLEDIMPYFDNNDDVAGYAYFMVADGMLVSGTEPSTYGNTYMSSSS